MRKWTGKSPTPIGWNDTPAQFRARMKKERIKMAKRRKKTRKVAKRRKVSKRRPAKRRRKGKLSKTRIPFIGGGSNRIPLTILEKRYKSLGRVIASRGGRRSS